MAHRLFAHAVIVSAVFVASTMRDAADPLANRVEALIDSLGTHDTPRR